MGLMILGLIAVGFYMTDLAADAPNKYDLYPLHKSTGLAVLMLFVVRLISRLRGPLPAPKSGLETWEVNLSHLVHGVLYVTMFSMAASGFMMNSTYPYVEGLDMFGLFTVPDITEKSEYWNGIFHTVHTVSAWIMSGALVLHIAGALKHRFFDAPERDVLARMV